MEITHWENFQQHESVSHGISLRFSSEIFLYFPAKVSGGQIFHQMPLLGGLFFKTVMSVSSHGSNFPKTSSSL